jgi:hypothetical protein
MKPGPEGEEAAMDTRLRRVEVPDPALLPGLLEEVEDEREQLVLDLRALPEEELQVKLVVEAAAGRPHRVGQIWLPALLGKKFKELVSRLGKRTETQHLVPRTVLLEPDLPEAACLALAARVAAMYEMFSDLGSLVRAHPVFEHHAPGAMVIIETRAARPRQETPAREGEEVASVQSEVEPDRKEIKRRRPHEKTFKKVRKFLRDATENGESLEVQAGRTAPADDKCFLCLAVEPFVLRRGLCRACTDLNQRMIAARTDLTGKFAIVTGGRIKIGFHAALRLLRDGCFVMVTTRFPVSGWKVFSEQPDFSEWKARLRVLALDLQDLSAITAFLETVQVGPAAPSLHPPQATVPHIDILINNAAQTLSRPPAFYNYLHREARAVLAGPEGHSLREVCTNLPRDYRPALVGEGEGGAGQEVTVEKVSEEKTGGGDGEVKEGEGDGKGEEGGGDGEEEEYEPVAKAAREDAGSLATLATARYFPLGRLDEEGQQVQDPPLPRLSRWTCAPTTPGRWACRRCPWPSCCRPSQSTPWRPSSSSPASPRCSNARPPRGSSL